MDVTEDHLLGGAVAYRQPRQGFRSGLEPVLLAATIPARPGETVLEAGTGAGAALLCLAARVPGLRGLGLERDPVLASLAAANAASNKFSSLWFVAGTVEELPVAALCDHVFANPPYHAAGGTPPAWASRLAAKHAGKGLLAEWTTALAASLRWHGTLTYVLPAACLPPTLRALDDAGCGSAAVFPLWPRAGQAAKLLLIRAVRGGRGPCRLLPGLTLHEADGQFTPEASRVLRDGAAMPF